MAAGASHMDRETTTSPQEALQGHTRTVEACHACKGDGYLVDMHGPGTFSMTQECWYPSEDVYPCPDCGGTGDHDQEPPRDTSHDAEEDGGWRMPAAPLPDPLEPIAEGDLPF